MNTAPLQSVLTKYGQWAQPAKQLLSKEKASTLSQAIQKQGGLMPHQEERLMVQVNRLLKPMNTFFNRNFTAGISPLLCADVFGEKEGKYLLFERGGKLAMFGGITDKGEPLKTTAERECYEESGYGCIFKNARPVVIRDYTLGGPIPKISVVYQGTIVGEPISNFEAQKFIWKTTSEIEELKEQEGFSSHTIMMQQVLKSKKQNSVCYMSSLKPLTEDEKQVIRNNVKKMNKTEEDPVVDETICEVEKVFDSIINEFSEFSKTALSEYPDFTESRDIIWPKEAHSDKASELKKITYEKEYNWNDFDRLWDFLKPWQGRLLSTNPKDTSDELYSLNKLFKTKIKIREAGTVRLVTSIQNEEGNKQSLSITQRYNESFSTALYRGVYEQLGKEIADGSQLIKFDDNEAGFEQDQFGNDTRTFFFESKIQDSTTKL